MYDLYKFEPLPEAWLKNLGTTDYDKAVELIENDGYQVIERCLAHCCEIISNNTDTYEEAVEMITRDEERFYPLSEYGHEQQIAIYNRWLAGFSEHMEDGEEQIIFGELPESVRCDLKGHKCAYKGDPTEINKEGIITYLLAIKSAGMISEYTRAKLLGWALD